MVDLNPDELYAKQLSPIDVSNALNLQNLILPAGTAKIGEREYQVQVNSSPVVLDELNNLPIKTVNGATVYHERRGAGARRLHACRPTSSAPTAPRGVLLTVTRNGKASTLAIVNAGKGRACREFWPAFRRS